MSHSRFYEVGVAVDRRHVEKRTTKTLDHATARKGGKDEERERERAVQKVGIIKRVSIDRNSTNPEDN